jgi:NTE family protein
MNRRGVVETQSRPTIPAALGGLLDSVRRRLRRRPLAVVLSGGGTVGAFQVGVIDVLARRGIRPDLIVGTSVGAINGAFWALHLEPDAGARLYEIWQRCERRLFLPGGRLQLLRSLMGNRDHLYPADFVTRVLADHTPPGIGIEDLPTALAITVCDAATGERVVLRQGNLQKAVLASSAIPGIFPPVRMDGRLYMDGGVVANCDLEAATEAGFGQAIAVALCGFAVPVVPVGMMDMVARTVVFTLRRQTELTHQAVSRRLRVGMIQPRLPGIPRLGDFGGTGELFELGRRYGEELVERCIDSAGNIVPGRLEAVPGPRASGQPAEPGYQQSEIA